MTRDEQLTFVGELSGRIVTEIQRKILSGAVPAEWDGYDLRQYLADRFADNVMTRRDRKAEARYLNDKRINNL